MPKVLISDQLSDRAVDIFRQRGIDVDFEPGLSAEDLLARIGNYDGLAIRSATKVTEAVLAAGNGRLKVVGRAGIGVDNVDLAAATRFGTVVMNTPFGNSITTAEHAISMMMALARQIPAADASTRAGKWEKSKFMGVELFGKTLGLIGAGNIGAIVADRAQGLKMKVVAFDPFLSPQRARDLGVEKVDLDTLLGRADFITVHTPLTEGTRNLIDAAALEKCKTGVRIINCARGGIVDETALKDGLESGKVAGAALDVFVEEPARDNPLFALENVVATPHLGAATEEAQENVALQVAEQMSDYLLTGAITNALNMPSISAEDAPRLQPYMALACQLGAFAGQVTESAIKSITMEFEGHVAKLNVKPLVQAALAEVMKPFSEAVNMVNAPVFARERGIDVSEVIHDRPGDYQTLIRLTLTTERFTRSVSGTLFGGKLPRLVNIKGIAIEAELSPNMLYITNHDKPGLIGGIGSILGDAGVNIATFHLGRADAGGDAIALISIDEALTPDLLAKLQELPQIKQIKSLTF
ncbi:MAG: phosphoglycerate dehydrogenase [Rhodospirillaceae bacterium]|nr:phosphoglycerate dehydrogenase [Rhodospirillaceae bacterium]MAX63033.1 phosphoglycerate dehydrogenase [Rhodospirillaceae bacterium]MBB57881.1 phosphoglycerate dehydrogenase [Rhodospirillaceae bacterium]|tara:strand:- start:7461 stop:9041 length:1581 start_codon:yes stop_codon:yes gene_type:complete